MLKRPCLAVFLLFLGTVAAAAQNGVDVSDSTCKVSSVTYDVQASAETDEMAGIYTDKLKSGQCYAVVISKVQGTAIAGTITFGPRGDWTGFTRGFETQITGGTFRFSTNVFGVSTSYVGKMLGPWKLRIDGNNKFGDFWITPRHVVRYQPPS